MLKIKDLYKQYEGKPLLNGVSFNVSTTETVCLLGRSGSGKSTILRIIAGLEEAERGEILWNGRSVHNIPPHQRNFGLMFQDYALFPHLTVFENVAFGLRVKGESDMSVDQRVAEVLDLVGMPAFGKRSVIDLSGGEKQRVAFARAIAPSPALLMLDEPMGALDRTLRDQLLRELKELLQTADIPVIYVTHDQEEAYAVADRILILHEGRIIQSGTPRDVYAMPDTLWTAKFLGINNMLSGKVSAVNPLTVQTPIGTLKISCSGKGLQTGDAVTILVRKINVCSAEEEDANCFIATVIESRFSGDYYQTTVRITENFTAVMTTDKSFQKGRQIDIFLDPESILCYQEGLLYEDR